MPMTLLAHHAANMLRDCLKVLAHDGANIPVVMKAGKFHRDRLAGTDS